MRLKCKYLWDGAKCKYQQLRLDRSFMSKMKPPWPRHWIQKMNGNLSLTIKSKPKLKSTMFSIMLVVFYKPYDSYVYYDNLWYIGPLKRKTAADSEQQYHPYYIRKLPVLNSQPVKTNFWTIRILIISDESDIKMTFFSNFLQKFNLENEHQQYLAKNPFGMDDL